MSSIIKTGRMAFSSLMMEELILPHGDPGRLAVTTALNLRKYHSVELEGPDISFLQMYQELPAISRGFRLEIEFGNWREKMKQQKCDVRTFVQGYNVLDYSSNNDKKWEGNAKEFLDQLWELFPENERKLYVVETRESHNKFWSDDEELISSLAEKLEWDVKDFAQIVSAVELEGTLQELAAESFVDYLNGQLQPDVSYDELATKPISYFRSGFLKALANKGDEYPLKKKLARIFPKAESVPQPNVPQVISAVEQTPPVIQVPETTIPGSVTPNLPSPATSTQRPQLSQKSLIKAIVSPNVEAPSQHVPSNPSDSKTSPPVKQEVTNINPEPVHQEVANNDPGSSTRGSSTRDTNDFWPKCFVCFCLLGVLGMTSFYFMPCLDKKREENGSGQVRRRRDDPKNNV